MTNDNEQHYFANDGTDWTTPPSPVNANEAREADKSTDEQAAQGEGPTATNEQQLHHSFIEQPEEEETQDDTDADAEEESDADGTK